MFNSFMVCDGLQNRPAGVTTKAVCTLCMWGNPRALNHLNLFWSKLQQESSVNEFGVHATLSLHLS